jgi:ABC-type polysaccharide/polyol phosphate transport system ATPase subunit
MTEDKAIVVKDLCKEFVLSHSGANSLKTRMLWFRHRDMEQLKVLRGISFEVGHGECVAVIGRNGAGKSTMLGLLARVFKPTSGEIIVNGRLAPLLELGAGFHPDLTGLENIFFNGVILGLTRKQIAGRLDQIIEFAEMRAHIDSPVRTYSSGMLARLGFAVAVHVDADILLVDEVLAVGDLEFERKCFETIEEFKKNGGTIFFVSHNMRSVKRVADRCIWVRNGVIEEEGDPDTVISHYQEASAGPQSAL